MTDISNGKQYVGQHQYDKEELDPNYHGSGNIIKQIYNKRPETIKEEYLKTCYTQQDMDEWEKYFIFVNNTMYPNGYNLEEGGRGGVPSEKTRQKMSEIQINGKHSKPVLQYTLNGEFVKEWPSTHEIERNGFKQGNVSACCRGKLKSHHGYVWRYKGVIYEEEIDCKTPSQRRAEAFSKPVLQYTLNGEFVREWSSTKECGRNGFCQTAVASCCRGEYKTYKGYVWRYKGVIYEEEINYKTPSQRSAETRTKPVLQYTLNGEFVREWPSTAECGRNGFNIPSIYACCLGKQKQHKGYIWRYKD